jgi:hypothetical protein
MGDTRKRPMPWTHTTQAWGVCEPPAPSRAVACCASGRSGVGGQYPPLPQLWQMAAPALLKDCVLHSIGTVEHATLAPGSGWDV